MSFYPGVSFEVSFPEMPDVGDVWCALEGYLTAQKCLPEKLEMAQADTTELLKISRNDISRLIARERPHGFLIYAGKHPRTVSYWLRDAKKLGNQTTLRAQIDSDAKVPENWNTLIEGLMTLFPSISAWQWNVHYEAWQGASRLRNDHFRKFFGEPPPKARRFVIKSDGIIPDQECIDVSLNPGRVKELIYHSRFHPTAEMWLGPHFWQYAKCTKEEVLAAGFFLEKRDTPHYLYLKCWQEPFTRPDGEQGRMQQRLWKLFFHEDCEWPPGSGTICDEPMYGPPELMPK